MTRFRLTVLAAVGALAAAEAARGTDICTWSNAAGGNWNVATNWNPQVVPSSPGDAAVLPALTGNYTVQLDLSPTIDWLRIDQPGVRLNLYNRTLTLVQTDGLTNRGAIYANSGAATIIGNVTNHGSGADGVFLVNGTSLSLQGPSVTNNGTVLINTAAGFGVSTLNFGADVTLGGSGAVVMNASNAEAQLTAGTGFTLTHAAGHTIRGRGQIHADMTNAGTINANVNGHALALLTNDKTNNGTMSASAGGYLDLSGITVAQGAGGEIVADAGIVRLQGDATIRGGTLRTANNGVIRGETGTNTLEDVANVGDFRIVNGNRVVNIVGAGLTNDGIILINTAAGFGVSTLNIGADVTLGGNGAVVMNAGGADAQLTTGAGFTLTHAAGHTIRGRGQIHAALTNAGTIDANVNGHALALLTNDKTNNGVMTASAGGYLDLSGMTVAQGAGGEIVADAGTVRLQGSATIRGGTLRTASGGVIRNETGANTLENVANQGDFRIANGQAVNILGPGLTNNGTMMVNTAGGYGVSTLNFNGNVALSGTGEVFMNAPVTEAQLTTGAGFTVTHAAGHTIRGRGQIRAALTNAGTINANVNGNALSLLTNDKTNNGMMMASGGGQLDLAGIAVAQGAGGEIVADAGTVRLQGGATIRGGTLRTANGGVIRNETGTNTLEDVANQGDFQIPNGQAVNVIGPGLTNNGTMMVNTAGGFGVSTLSFSSNVTLTGNGDVFMNAPATEAKLTTGEGFTIAHAAGHTIRGRGQIHADMTNAGTINANVNGNVLSLLTKNKTNTGTIMASGGGILDVAGVAVTQGGAGRIIADGGTVRLQGDATIRGGTFRTFSGGVIRAETGTNTLESVVNEGDFRIVNNNRIVHVAGTGLTNDGSVLVNTAGGFGPSILNFTGNATLGGRGVVIMSAPNTEAQLTTGAGFVVTQAAGHAIRGRGQIHADMISAGTIHANVNANVLSLLTNAKTNDGTMMATGGGILDVSVNVDGAGGWTADGGTVRFNSGVTATTQGPIKIRNNGQVQLTNSTLSGSDLTMDGTGRLTVASSMDLSGHLGFAMTEESRWSWAAGSTLTMTGGSDAAACNTAFWAALEVGGTDNGPGGSGVNNFGLRNLQTGDFSVVSLIDVRDNGNRGAGGKEALYVESLTLGYASTLNLNGLKLYAGGQQVQVGPLGGGEVVDTRVVLAADVNQDGSVDGLDAQAFVNVALGYDTDPAHVCAADMNADGVVNTDDVPAFADALIARG